MTLLFSIDADGLLTTDANLADGALDYEEQRDYEVIVTVSDGVAGTERWTPTMPTTNSGSLSGSPTIPPITMQW